MRSARAMLLVLAVAGMTGPLVGAVRAAHADEKETARRHLRLGVALYNELNYAGALAEFEASFKDLPSASALQNVALCQTKLFRYVEAIDTLERLRRQFGSSLSEADARAVEEALANLNQLVGTLSISVAPPGALVSINGRPFAQEQLAQPIRLSSGEYRISASAPDHAPLDRLVKVAGGESARVDLLLTPNLGQVTIRVNDPGAAIAIDRQPLAFGSWTGGVRPGDHVLQVYKEGHITVTTRVTVRAGDRMELRLPVGPPTGTAAQPDPAPGLDLLALPYEHSKRKKPPLEPERGWFGLVSASNVAVLASPDDFSPDDDADATGGAFGARLGYRIGSHVALEALFDTGSQSVSGTFTGGARETYDLSTQRYGGQVRFLAGGATARFSGGIGVGAVWHDLQLAGRNFSGLNSYFAIELGPQFNVGHVLLEGALQVFLEGANNVRDGDARSYTDKTIIPQGGLGLRVGYSQWGIW